MAEGFLEYRKRIEVAVLKRAETDEQFRTQLMQDPRRAVELVVGSPIPPGISVKLIEEKPTELYLVVPGTLPAGELQDTDLEAIAGGAEKAVQESSNYRSIAGVRG